VVQPVETPAALLYVPATHQLGSLEPAGQKPPTGQTSPPNRVPLASTVTGPVGVGVLTLRWQ